MSNENKISRNAPCPCGSGKKYKKCCGADAVAVERLHEAQSDPDSAPEGVQVLKDETRGSWMTGNPKWVMKLDDDGDEDPERDVRKILDGLLRPYYDRYCQEIITRGKRDGQFDVVILQNTQSHDEKTFGQAPSAVMARYCEMWEVYRKKLLEFFRYFGGECCECEVRYDNMCGGPILTLIDDDGDLEVFYLTLVDRFGVDD